MISMTLDEVRAAFKAQGVAHPADYAWVCPACKTVQSARDFAATGVSVEQAERYIGWSCIGRYRPNTRIAEEAKPGEGCDWTLGGLFKFHELEIIDDTGQKHPRFAIATPTQAQAQDHAAMGNQS